MCNLKAKGSVTDSNILIWDFIEQKYSQAFLTSINNNDKCKTINTTGTVVQYCPVTPVELHI